MSLTPLVPKWVFSFMEMPVELHVQNKKYKGVFTKVAGAATNAMWHLYIDNRYCGMLFITASGEFRFAGNAIGEIFEPLVNEMEDLMISWYQ